jgi:hypothetical protein
MFQRAVGEQASLIVATLPAGRGRRGAAVCGWPERDVLVHVDPLMDDRLARVGRACLAALRIDADADDQ